MEEGRVVRVAFQQADGEVKLRPAVVLKNLPAGPDLVVCAVSGKAAPLHAGRGHPGG
jgi:hypothetical protein